jgi:hypothetical protein
MILLGCDYATTRGKKRNVNPKTAVKGGVDCPLLEVTSDGQKKGMGEVSA